MALQSPIDLKRKLALLRCERCQRRAHEAAGRVYAAAGQPEAEAALLSEYRDLASRCSGGLVLSSHYNGQPYSQYHDWHPLVGAWVGQGESHCPYASFYWTIKGSKKVGSQLSSLTRREWAANVLEAIRYEG